MMTVLVALGTLVAAGGSGLSLWVYFRNRHVAHVYDYTDPLPSFGPVPRALFDDEKRRLMKAFRCYRLSALLLAVTVGVFTFAGIAYLSDRTATSVNLAVVGGVFYALTGVWEFWARQQIDPLTRQIGDGNPFTFLMNEANQGWPTDDTTLDARSMVVANMLRHASKLTVREVAETMRQAEYRETLPAAFAAMEESRSTALGVHAGGVLALREADPKTLTSDQSDVVAVSRLSTSWSGYLGTTKEAVAVRRMRQDMERADREPLIAAFQSAVQQQLVDNHGWVHDDIRGFHHYNEGNHLNLMSVAQWMAQSARHPTGFYLVSVEVTGYCRGYCMDDQPATEQHARVRHAFDKADTLPLSKDVALVVSGLRDSLAIPHATTCMWRNA
jgi:hypothetical protein